MVFAFLLVIVAVVCFMGGTLYGRKLESNAWNELASLKRNLRATGVKFETYLAGDVSRIKAEIEGVLAKIKI